MCLSDGRSYWMKRCMDEQQRTRSECADAHANLEWRLPFPIQQSSPVIRGWRALLRICPSFLDSYVKGPIFLTSWYMHIFFAQIFFEAAYPLGITWIDCDTCVTTSKKWVQKIKGQYMNRSTLWMIQVYEWVRFFKGQVYEWGRFWNTGSHIRTKITP